MALTLMSPAPVHSCAVFPAYNQTGFSNHLFGAVADNVALLSVSFSDFTDEGISIPDAAMRHITYNRTMRPNRRRKDAKVGFDKLDFQTRNLAKDLALHKAYRNLIDEDVVSDVGKPETFEEFKRTSLKSCKKFVKHIIKGIAYTAAGGTFHPAREFILDTGASMHMCCDLMLTLRENCTRRHLPQTYSVVTCNGRVTVTHEAQVYVPDLGLTLWFTISRGTPFLVSIGRLCQDVCEFFWPRRGIPFLYVFEDDVCTKSLELGVFNDVPVCCTGKSKQLKIA
jgi:hypothetical protein